MSKALSTDFKRFLVFPRRNRKKEKATMKNIRQYLSPILTAFEKNEHEKVRILGFGSSNTEHFLPGMHWFEWLDLAIRCRYGRVHTSINTGVGGDTTDDLLRRFETDAARYRPHLVFLTIGGNDSNPDRMVTPERYRENLRKLYGLFSAMGTLVVFQTYYAMAHSEAERLKRFHLFMNIVREIAEETGAALIDHLKHWEPFRLRYPEKHEELMHDVAHLNARGNSVFAAGICRRLGLGFARGFAPEW
ncbi:MAG: SGNH/GDSL hydrolase family protein, partial [Lentisphaerae bacterium]